MIASRQSSSLGLSSLYSQELSRRIGEALENKLDASGKQLHNQLQDLIIQPLYFRKSAKFESQTFLSHTSRTPHLRFQHASGKLFITAPTAINFLSDDIRYNCPRAQMKDLMRGNNSLNILDGIYTQILSAAIPSNHLRQFYSDFTPSSVLHIILLQNPLALRPLHQ